MPRVLDFSDGFESNSEPTQGSISMSAFKTFADDAAFVTDKGGAAADGDVYYNTTSDVARYYADGSWSNIVDDDTVQDIVNKSFVDASTTFEDDGDGTKKIKFQLSGITTATTRTVTFPDEDVTIGQASNTESESFNLRNHSLANSVGANALTIALKDRDGSDPTAPSPVKIRFRNSTAGTGTTTERSVTGALSVVVSSGSTLGHTDADDHYIYVYAIDNSGTVELAVSSYKHDEGSLATTVAEGGGGAADDPYALYSTTQRTDVPIRLIGRLKSNQTTAGTWAAAATEISLPPFKSEFKGARYDTDAGQSIDNASDEIVNFDSTTFGYDTTSLVTTGAAWKYTADESWFYTIKATISFGSKSWTADQIIYIKLYKNGVEVCRLDYHEIEATGNYAITVSGATDVYLNEGDYIDVRAFQNSGSAQTLSGSEENNYISISKL